MRGKLTLLAGVCAGAIAFPAFAQSADDDTDSTEIVVTAQRTAQRLQDVPIAVSAFSSEALEKQQIKNTSDLQLTLPNVTFTKGNFTGSSFTIRGIGDLCVGVACDSATAIHMNDAPLFGTRLFEGEFYDLAQIEVLRGPQGTLFGRNATSGVINFRTARPDLSGVGANAEAEYGNYNGVKLKGMVNMPVADTVGVRFAGYYLNRDGYTKNLFDNSRIDNRNLWGARGSLRFEPTSGTTLDVMAQYFHENDNRMRIQKQMCQRDATAVLGCLAATRSYEVANANATIGTIFGSKEFYAINGLPAGQAAFGGADISLGSVYGPDAYAGVVNPADPRVVRTDYKPTYLSDEWIVQAVFSQDLGSGLSLKVEGNWQSVKVDSQQDYSNSVQNRSQMATGLGTLSAVAGGALGAGLVPYLAPIAKALIPNGPTGSLCTSLAEPTLTGVFSGKSTCAMSPQDFDRSVQEQTSWTAEAIVSSDWDGPLNFLVGGIYGHLDMTESSYYVNTFGLDYAAGILGAFGAAKLGLPAANNTSYALASSFYRNHSDDLRVKTYGLFGEGYYKFNDQLKLTVGLRYNNDEKSLRARTTLFQDSVKGSVLLPTGSSSITQALGYAGLDFDANVDGKQEWAQRKVNFDAWTGRAVLDYQVTPDNLIYLSYSRGYKSGGINPPLSPSFEVPQYFGPETVNAFEIGSKNQFGNVTLNLTGFYYKYKGLQLSRIVARTSVNDNVSAEIYGLEAEAIMRPTRELAINIGASYLHTRVSEDKLLSNPRDFGAGRADAVIIKDITNGANCAVASKTGNVAGVNAYVNTVNSLINGGMDTDPTKAGLEINPGAGLRPTTSFGAGSGLASTGAFSICDVLNSDAIKSTLGASLGGVDVYLAGIPVNIKGNKLPGAPDYKFSAGAQYEIPVGTMSLTPRADFVYTGKSFGNIFNGPVNEIASYTQVNAQLQLDGADKKWFARVWVQNLFDKDAITGLYLTDQTSGNYTNVFTLEPRRFGVTAGMKF